MYKRSKRLNQTILLTLFGSATFAQQQTKQESNFTIRPRNTPRRKGRWHSVVVIMAVLVLSSGLLSLVRAAAGDLDPTFGSGGKVTTDFFAGQDRANDIAVQADGRIIVVGNASVSRGMMTDVDFAITRYNTDGSLDSTFGAGGKVFTDFPSTLDQANAVAIQSDGKIIIAGSQRVDIFTGNDNFALARYNPDGSLDSTFGSGGKVTTGFSPNSRDIAHDLAIQSDGKIVAVGLSSNSATADDFALARYNADGSLDSTFGSGGKVTTDFAGSSFGFDEANSVAIQSDGRIIAGGMAQSGDFGLARYHTDGSLDITFGTSGKVITEISSSVDAISALAIQSDGKIVAAGYALSIVGYDFAVARYNPDGSLDGSFGSGGKVAKDFSGGNDFALDVAIQFNGKIIVVGEAFTATSTDFGLVRYNTDGSPDSTFGSGGTVTTDFSGNLSETAKAVAIQSDGRIIAAGDRLSLTTSYDFALARYLGDVPPCSITCPSNIAVSNSPGQCGAVVTYVIPSGAGCGTVACFPSSGSLFPIGTTTVTCEPASGPACFFTVTVADTEAPTINCPTHITAVTPPGSAGAVVTFPAPTASDNCPGVTTSCSPPSGASFPLGTSTVTCTARDAASHIATCSFTVTVFDVCLQDDSNPQTVLLFNSRTGDYRFCCSGTVLTGRGTASVRRSTIVLEHNTIDRRVIGRTDQAINTGSAAIQSPPGSLLCTINDRDLRNNTCSCR
jgi:uncharacterized delta-60 repeat protein